MWRHWQLRVCAVCMNQRAASTEKQDEENCYQFWKLSGQSKQHCFELSAI